MEKANVKWARKSQVIIYAKQPLFPSYSLIFFPLNYPCNCFNSPVQSVKGFRTGLARMCHFSM